MAWSPEDRRKFLRGLDDAESTLLVFYKYLLYVLSLWIGSQTAWSELAGRSGEGRAVRPVSPVHLRS